MWSSSRPGLLEYLMETRCAPPPPLRTTSTLSHLVHRPRGQEIHAPWYGQIPRPKIYIYINHTSAVITCKSASSSPFNFRSEEVLSPTAGSTRNDASLGPRGVSRDNGVDSWCTGSGPEPSLSTPCWFYGADMALHQS